MGQLEGLSPSLAMNSVDDSTTDAVRAASPRWRRPGDGITTWEKR
jgi:hypothetical protein